MTDRRPLEAREADGRYANAEKYADLCLEFYHRMQQAIYVHLPGLDPQTQAYVLSKLAGCLMIKAADIQYEQIGDSKQKRTKRKHD
jgi:hypothetical protein